MKLHIFKKMKYNPLITSNKNKKMFELVKTDLVEFKYFLYFTRLLAVFLLASFLLQFFFTGFVMHQLRCWCHQQLARSSLLAGVAG